MELSRRQVLAGFGGAVLLSPVAGMVGSAFGSTAPDPATSRRRRLLVIFQGGGNDGLNTVVPSGDVPGAARYSVYRKVRPSIALQPGELRQLDRPGDREHQLGLHPSLATLHRLYGAGRVGIVQGVDYPAHNYSHFRSSDIWQSGEPGRSGASGWIGRHLDRSGIGEGELRGVAIGGVDPPLLLRGTHQQGSGLASIGATRFADGDNARARARHDALALFGSHPVAEPLPSYSGRQDRATVRVVRSLANTVRPPTTGNRFGDALLTARTLLEQDLGVECVFVQQGGYDTHTGQRAQQGAMLSELDAGLEAFYFGTYRGRDLGIGALRSTVADRTLAMAYSEFGRRIGEAGTGTAAGTDHGAAAPLFLVGPPAAGGAARLVPGLHGDHPAMGTTTLPADNLEMTTDLRQVYAAVLESWLRDPDPLYERGVQPLSGLFTSG